MKKTMAGRWRLLWVAAVLGVAWVSGAIAQEYPSFYRGVRPLAMGGAFTAVADDENALYYNAAGLADISMLNLAVLNPLVEGTEDGMEMYQDLQDTDFEPSKRPRISCGNILASSSTSERQSTPTSGSMLPITV